MRGKRTGAVFFVLVMGVVVVVGGSDGEAATARAGNQCKKRQIGSSVGPLTCVAEGTRAYWRRSTTGVAPGSCDPNYSPCVPIASDVDCAGGSGNGPAYVRGPVRVIGTDIYGLDRDRDGIGCESDR